MAQEGAEDDDLGGARNGHHLTSLPKFVTFYANWTLLICICGRRLIVALIAIRKTIAPKTILQDVLKRPKTTSR